MNKHAGYSHFHTLHDRQSRHSRVGGNPRADSKSLQHLPIEPSASMDSRLRGNDEVLVGNVAYFCYLNNSCLGNKYAGYSRIYASKRGLNRVCSKPHRSATQKTGMRYVCDEDGTKQYAI